MDEILRGLLALLLYFVVAASTALGCRALIRIPDELFRKILHLILLGSLSVFVFCFPYWWMAAISSVGFALIVYPVLAWAEHFRGFSKLTTERKSGELKHSLLLVFFMFAVVMALCWGWLGDRWLVITSIYAWGFGDAAAALVGKRWGKHKLRFRYVDKKKSVEGSTAMFVFSWVTVTGLLLFRGGLAPMGYVVVPVITALGSTLAEAVSKGGNDTVICPLTAMIVMLPLVDLFGGAM